MNFLKVNTENTPATRSYLNEWDDWFGDFFSPVRRSTASAEFFAPLVEFDQTEKEYIAKFDLPGVKKQDVSIELEDGKLVVTGERKSEKKSGSAWSEKSYGKFKRIFSLPDHVDFEKSEAKFEDGVLTIHLPKTEASKPRTLKIA